MSTFTELQAPSVVQLGIIQPMTEEIVKLPPQPTACNECASGLMHLRFITYFTWLNKELVTVPNFPAWVCDVCGRRDYDEKSVAWLTMLLNPETGHAAPHKRRSPRPRSRPATPRPSPDQS